MRYLLVLLVVLSSCTTSRTVFWNFASQKDVDRFPERVIEPSADRYSFLETEQKKVLHVDVYGKEGFAARSMDDFLSERKSHLAFLIIKDDSIIYEHYGEGVERTSKLTYFSVSKSIISMLVGFAMEEGLLDSVEDRIVDYIPMLQGKEGFEEITIEHLLAHTSGIRFRETYANPFSNDVAKIYYSKSLERVLKGLKMEDKPGEKFHYSSINTQLLGLVLQEVTGERISSYFERKIWKPIGAGDQASWSTYEKELVEKTFCCFNATPIDLAKLGRLALRSGDWDGNQLIPSDWFQKSLEQSIDGSSLWGYQWHWIIGLKEYGDFMAQGLYDQYIYVMPEKNVIIVSVNDFHNPKTNWPHLFRQLVDQLS